VNVRNLRVVFIWKLVPPKMQVGIFVFAVVVRRKEGVMLC
jgi:hypothetical protein